LTCIVNGTLDFTIVSAWDRLITYSGSNMPEGYSPVDFTDADTRNFRNF
jgi:hypothetical protein